jgi:hypothetical protein
MVDILEEIARDGSNAAARIAAIKQLREMGAGDESAAGGFDMLDEVRERRDRRVKTAHKPLSAFSIDHFRAYADLMVFDDGGAAGPGAATAGRCRRCRWGGIRISRATRSTNLIGCSCTSTLKSLRRHWEAAWREGGASS